MNGWANGMWKKALKNGAGIAAGVLLANITQPTLPIYSLLWFKKTALSTLTVFVVTELTYIKNWWSNANGGTT